MKRKANGSSVGEIIRDLRKSNNVAQQELARMVGLTPGALTNFEKGRRRISLDWLQKIAEALNTPMAYFIGDSQTHTKIVPGDPRERRLLNAWRRLPSDMLQNDFLRLFEDLGELKVRRRGKTGRR
jgi:transcriptional regulator with XRE-family HTH domain